LSLPTGPLPEAATRVRHLVTSRTPFAVPGAPPSENTDLVLLTSGSSGRAKAVGHSFGAVEWAAMTSRQVLGDGGWRWLLALSPYSAGGLMTVARSVADPLVWPGIGGRFDAAAFVDWYPGGADATSMVSTQVSRLLDIPGGAHLLQDLQVVLIGGGPVHEGLRRRCHELGIRTVATYGATETLGGCVYDGVPWPGVTVDIDADGQILLDGPSLAVSYVPGPALARPWPTGDLGRWQDGRLDVLGRADDRVSVKGVNRHLAEYEREALTRPGVTEAVAIAVPDEADGYRVVVFVEDDTHRLPRLETGKPDRQELRRRARGDTG
jgi:O-succinylbenzoic acid--CoA ligase